MQSPPIRIIRIVVFVCIAVRVVSTGEFGQDEVAATGTRIRFNQYVGSYDELRSVNETVAVEGVDDDPDSTISPGWWQPLVPRPLRDGVVPLSLSLEDVIINCLDHSKQIRVFSDLPLIRETAITEADSAFDWYGFIDSALGRHQRSSRQYADGWTRHQSIPRPQRECERGTPPSDTHWRAIGGRAAIWVSRQQFGFLCAGPSRHVAPFP